MYGAPDNPGQGGPPVEPQEFTLQSPTAPGGLLCEGWSLSPVLCGTPLAIKPLELSPPPLPCLPSPFLPMLSPGNTPCMGIGLGPLGSSTSIPSVGHMSLSDVLSSLEMDLLAPSDALPPLAQAPTAAPSLGPAQRRLMLPQPYHLVPMGPAATIPTAAAAAGRQAAGRCSQPVLCSQQVHTMAMAVPVCGGAAASAAASDASGSFKSSQFALMSCEPQHDDGDDDGTSRKAEGCGEATAAATAAMAAAAAGAVGSGGNSHGCGGGGSRRSTQCSDGGSEAPGGSGDGGGEDDEDDEDGDGSRGGAGGSEGHLNLTVADLEERGYFDVTLQQAAAELKVGVTTLKKFCRTNGLGRWPYRARMSLRRLRSKMQEYFAVAPPEEREAADTLMEREFKRLARMNVGAIDDAVKQFRQAMFKLEFKARQQLQAEGGAGAGRRRAAAVAGPAAPSGGGAVASGENELNTIIHRDAIIRQQALLHLRRLLNAHEDSAGANAGVDRGC